MSYEVGQVAWVFNDMIQHTPWSFKVKGIDGQRVLAEGWQVR
jgi:hypothetical protein